MRCLACGAEMRVVEVAADDTMMVTGTSTTRCSARCDESNADWSSVAKGPFAPPNLRRRVGHRLQQRRRQPPLPAPPGSHPPTNRCDPQPIRRSTATAGAPATRRTGPHDTAWRRPLHQRLRRPCRRRRRGHLPAEPVPTTTEPSSVPPAADDSVDEGEALLRRAIAMVRGSARGSQPTKGLIDGQQATPSALAGAMQSKKLLAGRVVQIQRDPDEPSYVAKDTKSGLSVLRHQDSARLRAIGDRIGWQVVDG